jgi:hypothetical protein
MSELRAAAQSAYEAALQYAASSASPWAQQLVDDASRLLGTVKWVEGDEERRRVDEQKQEEERRGR